MYCILSTAVTLVQFWKLFFTKTIQYFIIVALVISGLVYPHDAYAIDWPMVGANPQRTNWTPEDVPLNIATKWVKPIVPHVSQHMQVIGADVNGQKMVFVSTSGGLYAFDANTGSERWKYPTDLPLGNAPTYSNGFLYVGGLDKKLHKVNAQTGAGVWTFTADGGFTTNPIVADGKIYATNRDGALYAINDGSAPSLAWKFQAGNQLLESPAYKDGVLYFVSNDGYAYAVSAPTGTQIWQSDADPTTAQKDKFPSKGFFHGWPVIYGSDVIFMSSGFYSGNGLEASWLYCAIPGCTSIPANVNPGTLGNEPGPWAPGEKTLDLRTNPYGNTFPNYFETYRYRRNAYFVNRTTGLEHEFDIDNDGIKDAAPISWVGDNGTHDPPIVVGNSTPDDSDDTLYFHTNNKSRSLSFNNANISGWKVGTAFLSLPASYTRSSDEPTGISASGTKIYYNHAVDRGVGAIDVSQPNSGYPSTNGNRERTYINSGGLNFYSWAEAGGATGLPNSPSAYYFKEAVKYFWDPKVLPGEPTLPCCAAVFWNEDDKVGPSAYNGNLYLILGNALVSIGPGGAGASAPVLSSASLGTPPNNPSSVSDSVLQSKLEQEIAKMIAAGHLLPSEGYDFGHWSRGYEDNLGYYWHNPGELQRILLRALPHVSATLQQQLKTYLQSEFALFSPAVYSNTGFTSGGPDYLPNGTKRDSYPYPPYISRIFDTPHVTPQQGAGFPGWSLPPQNVYALWKYAQAGLDSPANLLTQLGTRLKAPITANGASLTDAYLAAYPHIHNAYIAGYKGYIELKNLAGQPLPATDPYVIEYNRLLNLRVMQLKTFPDTQQNFGNCDNECYFESLINYYNFAYMTPELGDFLRTNARSTDADKDILAILQKHEDIAPFWMMAHNPETQGEFTIMPYQQTYALFQALALVKRAPREELVKYLDTPIVPVGDLYYIDNIVSILEASSEPPSNQPCTITSAGWSSSSAIQGESVSLLVTGSGNCNNQTVTFSVKEYDSLLEGGINDNATVQPLNAVFSGSTAVGTWTAEWQNDCAGLCNPPEYFYDVTLASNGQTLRSSDPTLTTSPLAPTPSPTPTPIPPSVAGIPFGPFHFGDDSSRNDYIDPLTSAFSGSYMYVGRTSSTSANTVFQGAKDHQLHIITGIVHSNPCTYWNGITFDKTTFVSDAASLIPTVIAYYPDTIKGLMLLNEPHDPTSCTRVPVSDLYDSVKDVRALLAQYESIKPGISRMPIGFDAPPTYFENGLIGDPIRSSTDGTINLAMLQWASNKGTGTTPTAKAINWSTPEKAAAARMGMGIVYSINTRISTIAETLEVNTWECQQNDALSVWWYNWGDRGTTNVSSGFEGTFANYDAIRQVCAQTVHPTISSTPIPTITPTPIPKATNTPSPVVTPLPTPTPTNNPTPTPAPTNIPTPTPSGLPTSVSIPSNSISDNAGSFANNQVPDYEKFEVTFAVNTVASNLFYPYDPAPPSGLIGDGVSVEAQFTPDNWTTVYKQPAFYYQNFDARQINGRDWYYPTNNFSWKVRFAPNRTGNWQYKLVAQDRTGTTTSPVRSFTATNSNSHGFIKVAASDKRYFEYDDGTYFPALGYNLNGGALDNVNPIQGNLSDFQAMGANGIQLTRVWISQFSIYGESYLKWGSHNRYHTVVQEPRTSIVNQSSSQFSPYPTLAPPTPPVGSEYYMWLDFDEYLDTAINMQPRFTPCRYLTSIPVRQNTTYRIKVRYLDKNIEGPKVAGLPYGFAIKTSSTDFAATAGRCNDPDAGSVVAATYNPADHAPDTANPGWSYLQGTYTSGTSDFLPYLYLTFNNVKSTDADLAAGHVFIDNVWLEEATCTTNCVNLLSKSWMSPHEYVSQKDALAFDNLLDVAKQNNVYLKAVMMEKNDRIFQTINPLNQLTGVQNVENFYGSGRTVNKVRWLQEAWWRYMQARWGYSPNIHSWELLNEGSPSAPPSSNHWIQADEFGKYMKCRVFGQDQNIVADPAVGNVCRYNHPDVHLVSTSFSNSSYPWRFWNNKDLAYADVDYVDQHYYPSPTDTSPLQGFYDPAQFTYGLSTLSNNFESPGKVKPFIRGESGWFFSGTDYFAQNTEGGDWLHDFIWGGINAGGLMEQYFAGGNFTKHIYNIDKGVVLFDHRPMFKTYYDFIKNIPLNNGNYVDAGPTITGLNIRAWGQKDTINGRAHLWIANTNHTWKNIVDGIPIGPVTGTVTLSGFTPNANYMLDIWDTYTGTVDSTQTIVANDFGVLSIPVTNLSSDFAVQIKSTTVPPAPLTAPTLSLSSKTPTTLNLTWTPITGATSYWFQISNNSGTDPVSGNYLCTLGNGIASTSCVGSDRVIGTPTTNGLISANTVSIQNLSCNTTYYAHTKAINSLASSPWSSQFTSFTTSGCPLGDATSDGIVDQNDFGVWFNNFDTQTATGAAAGDFTADGIVDGLDYVTWLNNYSP